MCPVPKHILVGDGMTPDHSGSHVSWGWWGRGGHLHEMGVLLGKKKGDMGAR